MVIRPRNVSTELHEGCAGSQNAFIYFSPIIFKYLFIKIDKCTNFLSNIYVFPDLHFATKYILIFDLFPERTELPECPLHHCSTLHYTTAALSTPLHHCGALHYATAALSTTP